MKEMLGRWGKKAAEATKKAEDLAGNMWQHCKPLILLNNQRVLYLLITTDKFEFKFKINDELVVG